jgi:two-component system sensor histidine kinase VanS
MGRHSIKVKITLLLTVIITSLIVLLLILNSTLSEKFYFSDKQECMLNTYSKINQIMNDYDAGTVSESQMSDSIEQLTGSAAISVIVVNSDWTTVYSNINGEQDMINRLLRSIFNKDVFGTSDSAPQQNSNNENAPGDMQDMHNPDKGNSDNGSQDKNNPKNKDDISINMSDSGIEENRDIMTQTDLYTLQKVYDNRLGDDYYELFGTLSNGDSIMLRMALQGIKDNVSISNTFITYVGIGILIIGVIAAYIFSSYITKPIQQLSDIAERMSNLDFDVKYHGKDKSEIGVLGNSMNNMSKKLEENISQLKSANKELQRDIDRKVKMEEVRTEFLSNVSHELKTPIALIQGYAEGLKEGISDDPESMDFYCDVIIDEAGKMNNMVKKLLTLNQIEFGNEELVMERFDIIELITSIVNANELRASQKGIQIEFNQRDEQIDVWSDEYKIEEVVTNYITNAINHCDFENRIEVSVERVGDDVRVHVFNTGKNIPEEDIPNIWQKFYKVDKARTREYGGNGIGLSIVKAIMDSYGKGFGVINKSNGVEFWFDLKLWYNISIEQ